MNKCNTITIVIDSVTSKLVKYFMVADTLNNNTRAHTYIIQNNSDIKCCEFSNLIPGDYYVVYCENKDSIWYWTEYYNITSILKP